jgi:hypothetical protein
LTTASARRCDISQEMLEAARGYTGGDPRVALVDSPRLTERADFSFVSGTFNVRMEADEAAWAKYVCDTLLHLKEMSARGFAFNLLSTYVDWKAEKLFYADPLFFFDFCKRHVSPRVSLLHDYPLYEWTLLVRTEG